MLHFRHQAIGAYYVNALHNGNTGEVFLPLTELLELLQIPYERDGTAFTVRGRYPATQQQWEVNLHDQIIRKGERVFELTADDYRLMDFDWFLLPGVFAQAFGLHFHINMTVFRMGLMSDYPLPAEERQRRELIRTNLSSSLPDQDHPLLYPRSRQFAGAGMLDYNLSSSLSSSLSSYNHFHTCNLTGGMEIFGGDLQGSMTGSYSSGELNFYASDLHWRFVPVDNPYLTTIRAGQISTTGLQTRRIVGGGISNDPVMPRRTFETFIIDGTTVPDSEVELYVNTLLADYTVADELGYYRFDYPLSYGTALMSLRIYKPTGEVVVREQRIQVPFTFLPVGVVSYNIQGGFADNGKPGTGNVIWHGDLAYGLSPAATLKAGVDYAGDDDGLLCYVSISARIFRQYLLNIDAAPGFYYRASTSAHLAGGRSFNMVITHFDSHGHTHKANQHLQATFYLPFSLLGVNAGLRFGGEHLLWKESFATTHHSDLSLRLGQVNLRMNYRGQLAGKFDPELLIKGLLHTSATYSFGHSRTLPGVMRTTRVRLQGRYDTRTGNLVDVGVQMARNLGRKGRLTLNADHNLVNNQTLMRIGLVIDMQATRSNTQATGIAGNYAVQQTLSGSIGLDAPNRQIIATNRNQVGQAAASVVAFIDSNNSGQFDPGEEVVPLRNINISGGTIRQAGNDGIMRISQLQSYWRYNVELRQSAIPNPTLKPLVNEFSFVADPNSYKRLEIPLYRTGTIEGLVKTRTEEASPRAMSGVRLLLTHLDTQEKKQLRTFSNGSFYAMHLRPGSYTLEVEPTLLDFTGKESLPAKHIFNVKALAHGHCLEGLDFLLIPANMDPFQKMLITMTDKELQYYEERLKDINRHFYFFSLAQEAFYEVQLENALNHINNSLNLFETDYALALKGSILFAMNQPEKALRFWELAGSRNPDIEIPKLF